MRIRLISRRASSGVFHFLRIASPPFLSRFAQQVVAPIQSETAEYDQGEGCPWTAGRRLQVPRRVPPLVNSDDSAVYLQVRCVALEFALAPRAARHPPATALRCAPKSTGSRMPTGPHLETCGVGWRNQLGLFRNPPAQRPLSLSAMLRLLGVCGDFRASPHQLPSIRTLGHVGFNSLP